MFNANQCYDLFASEKDTAYFWSGLGHEGASMAAEVAERNDATTLEMLMIKNKDALISAGFDYDAELDRFMFSRDNASDWRAISQAYAEQASGNVHVVLGENVRENSIWNTHEFPALKENDKINSIISVDPATGKESSILYINPNNSSLTSTSFAPSDAQLPSLKREPDLDGLFNTPKATQDSLTAVQTNVVASSAADAAQNAASSLKGGLGV